VVDKDWHIVLHIELSERNRPRRRGELAITVPGKHNEGGHKPLMCYTQHGAIYNPYPTQRRPETHPYPCLLQLANPLLTRFEVSPTNTLCDHHLTWLLRRSSPSQIDGKVSQRHQGGFDTNVRV
jgi:hypothetical protein